MSEEPLPFSVVIPAYNAETWIADALDSVARQTLTDYEVVVVDDGSRDSTSKRVRDWTAVHSNVELRLVRQENRGIGEARNAGVQAATGVYVAFLDADDLWMERKLEAVAGMLNGARPADLVCHDEWREENGTRTGRLTHGPYSSYRELLFKGNAVSTSAAVVRRDRVLAVGGFSPDLRLNGMEDYDLWLRLARSGCSFEYLHEVLGIYRVHGGGIASRIEEHCEHGLNLLVAHSQAWPIRTPYYRFLMRKRRSDMFRAAGRAFEKRGEHQKALEFFRKALHEDPFSWKAWGFTFLTLARITV